VATDGPVTDEATFDVEITGEDGEVAAAPTPPVEEKPQIKPIPPKRTADGRFDVADVADETAVATPKDASDEDLEAKSDTETTTDGEPEETPQKDYSKPRHSARARVEQATRQAKEERQRADAAERRSGEMEARLKALEQGQAGEQEPPVDPNAPNPDKYKTYEDYVKAMTQYTVKQEGQVRELQARAGAYQRAIQQSVTSFQEKLQAAATKHPDFMERVSDEIMDLEPSFTLQGGRPTVYNAIADEIFDLDDLAPMMLHLSEHPDVLQRLATLKPRALVREMARLDASLSTATTGAPVRAASRAKPPVSPVTGSPTNEDTVDQIDDFDEFFSKANRRDKIPNLRR